MTELSGTLDGLGLPAIVRFLSGLQKTGWLRVSQDDWHGELGFDAGKLVHASLGGRDGLAALDALIEVLPHAAFVFDSQDVSVVQPSIDLERNALLAHLDEVSARIASGHSTLPALNAVPTAMTVDAAAEEPVQLDRAALQTLLAVDGQRTVREIVARRGSVDALWHLGRLVDAGLIQLATAPVAAPAPVTFPSSVPAGEASVPTSVAASAAPRNDVAAPEEAPALAAHCPKLGFEDDPSSSFGRPTRLHRCFAAAGRPLPLSMDQQRELCLSEQFGTCPRLLGTASNPPAAGRPGRPGIPRPEPSPTKEPRIVRLPIGGRPTPAMPPTQPEHDAPAASTPAPRPLRPFGAPPADRGGDMAAPTPLRARLNRTPNPSVATPPAAPPAPTAPSAEPVPVPMPRREAPVRPPVEDVHELGDDVEAVPLYLRKVGPVPLLVIPAVAIAVIALAALVYVLPRSDVLNDGALDPNTLPNARAVEAGTPVANLVRTPIPARATAVGVAVQGAQATAEPTVAANQAPTSAPAQAPAAAAEAPSPAPAQTAAPLFDERFAANDAGWPSNPIGAALITNGTYRIATRQAGQFAAVSAPVGNVPSDVVVSATFRKLAGPSGGGYGIILRDQETALRDGTSQDGHYYVLEVGDKGEVGIWRRDGDHWVDLLPWQHSDAVKPGNTINELVASAIGTTLSLSVNGTPVATRTDATFSGGRTGLFVGGDGNQVAISRFTIQTP